MLGAAMAVQGASATAAEVSDKTVGDISRYCSACWRNARLPADFWQDCTQEVLCRLLERVPVKSWNKVFLEDGEERREFIRAIDAIKKRNQRARKWTGLESELADRRTAFSASQEELREAVNVAAGQSLSKRQQRILDMSFEGHSAQEIARALGMSSDRVSDEKYKAIRKLRLQLGVDGA
jgi:RNA polymerase sigma factor (sigma-70 family)